MAGRRPKPRDLKLVTGNPGKRRIPEDEPIPVAGAPEIPRGLSRPAVAEWERLVAELEGEQRLSLADRGSLEIAARAHASALEFERRAKQRGLPHDEWRKFKTGERIQWDTYRKALNDLCLSQGTRARAKVGGRGKATSKLGGFLERRAARGAAGA